MMRVLTAAAALLLCACACACATVPAPSSPGSELIGRTMTVEIPRSGTTTLRFGADGSVTGTSDGGQATGRWSAADGRICTEFPRLGRECYPYAAPFRRGVPVSLTGTSGVTVRATLQ